MSLESQLQAILDQAVANGDELGCQCAVWSEHVGETCVAAGWMDAARTRPATAETLFPVFSVFPDCSGVPDCFGFSPGSASGSMCSEPASAGPAVFSGKILGGCIDSLYDLFSPERYADMPLLCEKYGLFPDAADWKGRILLLETSEEKPSPEKYREALEYLKGAGVFEAVSGVLVGKPMDESYAEEYRQLLVQVIDDPTLPVVFNLNVGHAMPRCIIPFGVEAVVDAEKQVIRFED